MKISLCSAKTALCSVVWSLCYAETALSSVGTPLRYAQIICCVAVDVFNDEVYTLTPQLQVQNGGKYSRTTNCVKSPRQSEAWYTY